MPRKVFLLSPASTSGLRAKQLMSPRAQFPTALRFRAGEVMIGEAFAFMSALYFRGKIGYALHFGGAENTFVIAPGYGLVPPTWTLNEERMKKMSSTDVDMKDRTYVKTLRDSATKLAKEMDDDAEVVLLGSVASGKYVDVLLPIFGERLRFPHAFAGLGDMSRGGLMLRAVRANCELEYVTLDKPRHRGPGGSGKMPLHLLE
ncbi:MAG TPA: hypothetical protein VGJ81_04975 [Thermoanaerobaculia bacterium]|jgi:hypothetical protein